MNRMKRILAMALVLCVALGAVPLYGFAETTEEEQALADRKSETSAIEEQAAEAIYALTTADTGDVTHMASKPEDGTTENEPFPENTGGSYSFRIPAMVTLSDGTLVAAADARWNTTYDGGGLDTIVSRSSDNGANWNYTFANYLGDNGNVYNGSSTCFIDPSLAVTANDTIYMLVDLYPYGVALNGNKETTPETTVGFDSSGNLLLSGNDHSTYGYYLNLEDYKIYSSTGTVVSGYTVDKYFNITSTDGSVNSNLFFYDSPYKVVRTGFLYLTKSTDKGATWSAPTLLNLKTSSEQVCLVGPGRGLVTKSGTIIFPVYSYKLVNNTEYKYTSLIYSTDNGATWKRSASMDQLTSSEATMVELGSGKIRTFFRNDNATLCYADYDLTGASWDTYVNTGVAVNSDTELSAITYSKTVGGKQVILVSCPTGPNAAGSDNNNGAYRSSGKIFAGIVNDDNTMTWQSGSVAVTPVATAVFSGSTYTAEQGFFAYSSLAELSNNSVAILYEDNQYDWGAGTGYGYTMDFKTYTESDLETAFGVTFDEETDTDTDTGTETPETTYIYKITDTPTDVTVNFTPTDVTGWIMTVTPNQTVTGVASAKTYAAYDVTITDDEGNAYTGTAEVKLPLTGLSDTTGVYPFIVETDGTATKIENYIVKNGYITFIAPHFSVVGAAVDTEDITGEDTVEEITTGTQDTYELDTDGLDTDASYLIVYRTGSTSTEGLALNTSKESVNVTIDGNTATPEGDASAALWTYTTSGSNSKYLSNGNNYLYPTSTGNGSNRTYSLAVDDTEQSVTITNNNNGTYRIYRSWKTGNRTTTRYVSYDDSWGVASSSQNLYFYKYTGGTAVTKYTANCEKQSNRIDAYTITEQGNYTDESWNAYTAALEAANNKLLSIQARNDSDDKYATEAEANADITALTAEVDALETAKNALVQKITITIYYQLDGTTVKTETQQVATDTESLTLPATIQGDNGESYKVENTTLTLSGDLTYAVSVKAYEIRYIDLYVGESKTDRILETAYTDANVTANPDTSIAVLDSVKNGTTVTKVATEITSEEDLAADGQYVIVNVKSGNILTDTQKNVSGNWADKIGLEMAEEENLPYSTELWTITKSATEDRYTITQNDQYLTMAGYYAGMSATETTLVLTYTESGWKVYDDTTYTAKPDGETHDPGNYYLHDGVGDNYTDGALGAISVLGENGYWKIYKIEDGLEVSYTDVTFTGEDVGTTTAVVGDYKYVVSVHEPLQITVNYQLNETTIKTETLDVFADDASVTLDSHVLDANNNLYVVKAPTLTLTEGVTEYNVPVTEYTGVVSSSSVAEGAATTITATLTDGQYVTWHTPDSNYVGVAGEYDSTNGVSTNSAVVVGHKTTITTAEDGTQNDSPAQVIGLIHNADGTVVGANVWNVTVTAGTGNSNTTTKYIYVDIVKIEHSTVYYSVNGGALVEITDDMLELDETGTYYKLKVPLYDEYYTGGFQITLFAAPEEGYALTALSSTNSDGEYYSMVGEHPYGVDSQAWPFAEGYNYDGFDALASKPAGNNTDTFDTSVGMRWGLVEGNLTVAQLKVMYANAIEKGCAGMLCFTKNKTGTTSGASQTNYNAELDLVTDIEVVSEKIATVKKDIAGILPVTKLENGSTTYLQKDYRTYEPGMIATTGDLIYFKITVTLERPSAWQKDTNGNDTNLAALVYSDATLTDKLEGAYFYSKDLDADDGDQNGDGTDNNDGYIKDPTLKKTTQDITDALIAEWAEDEETRELVYYVLYEIQDTDIPKYTIENNVTFEYDFNSTFSTASAQTATGTSTAAITVVQTPMDDVIIDFTQPFTITGLTNEYLKYAYVTDDLKTNSNLTVYKATYGTVEITKKVEGYKTVTDEDGNETQEPITDNDGVIRYLYTLTYTPNPGAGIMQKPDVVEIYGTFVDTETKLPVEKLINAFAVYPATTIYYEEDYVQWDTGDNGWKLEGEDTVTDYQQYDRVSLTNTDGDDTLDYNYGYDKVYEGSNVESNGTQASTSVYGAKGTFVFTGTGFEIYANCTPSTGYVMVLVKGEDGSTRLYTVNTAVDAGDTAATTSQSGNYYSVPIVSVQDLAYGKYTVSIIKSVDVITGEDGTTKPADTPKSVNIDGIRIFGTIENQSIYMTDSENDPKFVELRDLVLTGVNVETNVTDSVYSTADSIISQVYSDTGTLTGALVLSNNQTVDAKDLLENGPKNELYLWPGQAVTFTLANSVTAQIGMKTVSGGSVTYTYANNGGTTPETCTLNSSTDMFYHDGTTGEVTITNNSGGVLSITLLKYWVSETEATLLSEVTESQVAYAVMSLREPAVEETEVATLTVNYVTQSSRVSVSFGDKVISLPGRKIETVTLTKVQSGEESEAVFTADEIRAALPDDVVIRNLQDIQVPYGQSATRTFFASRTNQSRTAQTYVLERTF